MSGCHRCRQRRSNHSSRSRSNAGPCMLWQRRWAARLFSRQQPWKLTISSRLCVRPLLQVTASGAVTCFGQLLHSVWPCCMLEITGKCASAFSVSAQMIRELITTLAPPVSCLLCTQLCYSRLLQQLRKPIE